MNIKSLGLFFRIVLNLTVFIALLLSIFVRYHSAFALSTIRYAMSGAGNVGDGDYDTVQPIKVTFKSIGSQDGWILESTETSNQGGTLNNLGASLIVGDNAQDKQYRSILSFNTSGLPDNTDIVGVRLRIKVQGITGGDLFVPTKILGNLVVDIRKPYFGSSADFAVNDFQAGANENSAGALGNVPDIGWRTVTLKSTAYDFINLNGTTQFRLRFQKDDNDDHGNNYLTIYTGNASAVDRPQLIVEYFLK